MKSREYIEDTIQRIVCELLPKMPPQDIRPAYQENDTASKIVYGENDEVQTVGFTPLDNFIYITAKIGTNTALTSINKQGDVNTGFAVEVTFTFYGNQSPQLSLCLFSLLEIDNALSSFESGGLYLYQKAEEISEMRELINEQWFERHEFDAVFLCTETIRSPFEYKEAQSSSVSISSVMVDGDKEIKGNIMEVRK